MGVEYPVEIRDLNGSERVVGTICFPDVDLQPGARWYDGGGAPSDSYGSDGDYYLDVDTGNVWRKDGGSWA